MVLARSAGGVAGDGPGVKRRRLKMSEAPGPTPAEAREEPTNKGVMRLDMPKSVCYTTK